jgi:pimeloyl-ACP methyl ester carboxylesterase
VLKIFLNIDGINVNYKRQGNGKKVVLLHGWGGSSDSFLPVFNYLSQQFEVYAIDFPGFGDSDIPSEPWDVTDYSTMLHRFFELLQIDKAMLIGHSFGGRVAILFSAKYPFYVGKIVLTDSAGIIPNKSLLYYLRVYKFKLMRKFFVLFYAQGSQKEKVEQFYQKYGSNDYKQAGALRQTFVKVVNQDLRGYLPQIKAPTLIIWGECDQDTPLYYGEIMEKEIPDAGLVVFKGVGHFAYLDKITDFNIIVAKFFRGQ